MSSDYIKALRTSLTDWHLRACPVGLWIAILSSARVSQYSISEALVTLLSVIYMTMMYDDYDVILHRIIIFQYLIGFCLRHVMRKKGFQNVCLTGKPDGIQAIER